MTTFSPGNVDAFNHDLEIPIEYGFRIPVSMIDELLPANRTWLSQFTIG